MLFKSQVVSSRRSASRKLQTDPLPNGFSCWVCGFPHLALTKQSNIAGQLGSEAFMISDKGYGITADIYRCLRCDFLQCSDFTDVLPFYFCLQDEAYDAGRAERAIRARRILSIIRGYKCGGRLLDIGAATGGLVEQALSMGYQAEGIEPSRWMQQRAQALGLPVHLGTLPHPAVKGPFDVVALIDVLEHVPEPVQLLSQIATLLTPDGIGALVTPDVGSLAARLLGTRWWHYRIEHIGYFKKSTLLLALERAGLEAIGIRRPTWYFNARYLVERANVYLPPFLRLPDLSFGRRIVVLVNLRDSMLWMFRKRPAESGLQAASRTT